MEFTGFTKIAIAAALIVVFAISQLEIYQWWRKKNNKL